MKIHDMRGICGTAIGYASLIVIGIPAIIGGGTYALLTFLSEKHENARNAFNRGYFNELKIGSFPRMAFVHGLESSLKEIFPNTARNYGSMTEEINNNNIFR